MRPPRIEIPGYPYHVFPRGNNKQVIFHDDQDRAFYLKKLKVFQKTFGFILYTFALMDNHLHLLLQLVEGVTLSSIMHRLQLSYAVYFNKKYGRVGHVFQGRYHAQIVDTDRYFIAVDRYIHLNPVRAGMVAKPGDWKWSSYRARLENRQTHWLTHKTVLDYFGNNPERQIQEYREFTEAAIHRPEEWSHSTLQKMNIIGSVEFSEKIRMKKICFR